VTISVVLADANILFSRTLRDYFLYAADGGAIEIRWSQQILDEMSRNLREAMGFSADQTDRLERLMNDYMEHALVEVTAEAEAEVADVVMDAKDRHVLAAAISAEADILLTDNTPHFPMAWMDERGLELIGAGDLLIRLAESMPNKIRSAHAMTLKYTTKSEDAVFATLERCTNSSVVTAVRSASSDG
jgi:predicted nucleic acid-binding protein